MSTLFSHFFTKINQITPLESDFTEVLSTIALKPKTLYFYGKMPQNVSKSGDPSLKQRPKTVAIVGSRRNTRYGEEVAYQLAYALAKRGVIVISGLAYGIDSIGHRGCLDAGGTTVAVLGNAIDRIRPSSHTKLAEEILAKNGAIISEYPPSTTDLNTTPLVPGEYLSASGERAINYKASFLYRNRLIAGLADVTVVVEAAIRSGSLNTATHALAMGKDVFAVPGPITAPYSQGCNKLIAEGALAYTEPSDILNLLFPEDCAKNHKNALSAGLVGDSDIETIILKSIAAGARSGEQIMQLAKLPPELFNQAVTLLEIKGRLRSLGANNWALA